MEDIHISKPYAFFWSEFYKTFPPWRRLSNIRNINCPTTIMNEIRWIVIIFIRIPFTRSFTMEGLLQYVFPYFFIFYIIGMYRHLWHIAQSTANAPREFGHFMMSIGSRQWITFWSMHSAFIRTDKLRTKYCLSH